MAVRKGNSGCPDPAVLLALARLYHVDFHKLIGLLLWERSGIGTEPIDLTTGTVTLESDEAMLLDAFRSIPTERRALQLNIWLDMAKRERDGH